MITPEPPLANHIRNQLKLNFSPLSLHMYSMTVKNGTGNTLHDASNLGSKFGKKASSVTLLYTNSFHPQLWRVVDPQ
jgi:hypothetical protein